MTDWRIKSFAAEHFRRCGGGRLLDAPAGVGWLSKTLLDQPFECYACDRGLEPHEEWGPKGAIFWREVDLNGPLPFPLEFFDYVACIEGIEHLEGTRHVLREFARVLRPGGELLLTTPNILYVLSRLRFLTAGRLGKFPHVVSQGDLERGDAHITPVHFSTLHRLLGEEGFCQIRCYFVTPRKRWKYLPVSLILYLAGWGVRKCTGAKGDRAIEERANSWGMLTNSTLVVTAQKRGG